jgi:hypothetical protein
MARIPKRKPKLKGVTVSSEVKDYSKDPYFVKKTEESKKVLEKYGFPKEMLPKK